MFHIEPALAFDSFIRDNDLDMKLQLNFGGYQKSIGYFYQNKYTVLENLENFNSVN